MWARLAVACAVVARCGADVVGIDFGSEFMKAREPRPPPLVRKVRHCPRENSTGGAYRGRCSLGKRNGGKCVMFFSFLESKRAFLSLARFGFGTRRARRGMQKNGHTHTHVIKTSRARCARARVLSRRKTLLRARERARRDYQVALVQPGAPLEIVTNHISKRKSETAVSFVGGDRLFSSDASGMLSRKPDLTSALAASGTTTSRERERERERET